MVHVEPSNLLKAVNHAYACIQKKKEKTSIVILPLFLTANTETVQAPGVHF